MTEEKPIEEKSEEKPIKVLKDDPRIFPNKKLHYKGLVRMKDQMIKQVYQALKDAGFGYGAEYDDIVLDSEEARELILRSRRTLQLFKIHMLLKSQKAIFRMAEDLLKKGDKDVFLWALKEIASGGDSEMKATLKKKIKGSSKFREIMEDI